MKKNFTPNKLRPWTDARNSFELSHTQVKKSGQVDGDKRPKIGVGVLIFKDNKILLGERINTHGSGTWCPPGGHLEFGETPQDCAIRELLEETGLVAKETISGPWTNDFFENEGKHYVSLYMIVTEFEGTPTIQEPEKCLGWEWFSFDDLPSPLFLSLSNLIKRESLSNIKDTARSFVA